MTRPWFSVALLLGVAVDLGGSMSFQERAAVQESLSRVHPRMRASWLKERGIRDPHYTRASAPMPDSSELREVGRWSYGPSYDVDGRTTPSETLVALARGSGVSLLRFSRLDSLKIELLTDINAEGLMCRVRVADTLLYVGSRAGLEVWNIADEQSPVRLSWTPLPLNDFALQDSLVYTISGDDSFRTYNISNPADPVFRGACRDSGSLVSVAGNAAFIGDRWGLYVVDVTNPASPHRIGSWGSGLIQVQARGKLCYVTTATTEPGDITFHILDVTVPASPYELGSLNSVGGYDVCLVDTLAYCAGDYDFNEPAIVSVADSTRPRLVGSAAAPGWCMGIWASGLAQAAFVGCHWEGLQVYDTRNTSQPVRDTSLLAADNARDIWLENGRAYVADYKAGLRILDVTDPTKPTTLGSFDTAGQAPAMRSAAAKDSFAFINWVWPELLSLDVSDPTHPVRAGGCDSVTNNPEDIVIRDSLAYLAEASFFQIVNVARPREPVLAGTCVLPGTPGKLVLSDSIAYAATYGVQCVSITDLGSPFVVGTYGTEVSGLDMVDTIMYGDGPYTGIIALSMANPASPRLLDSLYLTDTLWWNDVVVVGSLAYVGGERMWVVDVSDPQNLRLVPGVSWMPPYEVKRLFYAPPYLYAACYEAGVCVLETVQVGVGEERSRARLGERPVTLCPNPASRCVTVHGGQGLESAVVRDVLGRLVMTFKPGGATFVVDLAGLRPGLYFIELRYDTGRKTEKLIKQ